jgi:hypothetical protein
MRVYTPYICYGIRTLTYQAIFLDLAGANADVVGGDWPLLSSMETSYLPRLIPCTPTSAVGPVIAWGLHYFSLR